MIYAGLANHGPSIYPHRLLLERQQDKPEEVDNSMEATMIGFLVYGL